MGRFCICVNCQKFPGAVAEIGGPFGDDDEDKPSVSIFEHEPSLAALIYTYERSDMEGHYAEQEKRLGADAMEAGFGS